MRPLEIASGIPQFCPFQVSETSIKKFPPSCATTRGVFSSLKLGTQTSILLPSNSKVSIVPSRASLFSATLCTRLEGCLVLPDPFSTLERCSSRIANQKGNTKAMAVTNPDSAYQMMCFIPMRLDSMNMNGTAAKAVTSRSNESTRSTSLPNQLAR